jgi:tetratricopeptide (TPR) repeat protein
MSSSSDEPRPPGDEPAPNGRLDSWKEIAAYLRRSVRSAKRWEKEQQLPIHRHHHGQRDSVYAYRTELDSWWENRGAKLVDQNGADEAGLSPEDEALESESGVGEPEHSEKVLPPAPHRPRRTALVAGITLAVVLARAIAWVSRSGSGASAGSLRPLPFKARDWVLVTRFENRTGRPIFDGTLEAALERELRNSRYLNVVSRERINDALALMRKPDTATVDAALGREICLRDGGIRALVTGRIEKLGSKFLLSVNLLDPARGVTVASVAEEAAGEAEALPAIQRASDRLRKTLGEALPDLRLEEARLAKVTTRSLRALQLYSQAEPLVMKQPRAAQELLSQAVAEDPEFAAGHMLLSEAIFGEKAPASDAAAAALPHAEIALRLSESSNDWERYYIRGCYYDLTGNTEKAATAYEALLALHPDDVGALNNLVPIYGRLGREAESLRCALRRADLTPNDFRNQLLATYGSLDFDPAGADRCFRRARALISTDVLDRVPQQAAFIYIFPAFRLWAEGNVEKGAAEADRIWREIEPTPLGRRDAGLQSIASFFLSLGKLRTAEDVYQRISSPQMRLRGLAMVSYYRGDQRGLVDHLKAAVAHPEEVPHWAITGTPPFDPVLGILLARAGMFPDAERIVAREKKRESIAGFVEVVQGELALARGKIADAVRLLGACCHTKWGPGPSYYFGIESLASALDKGGDSEEAIRALEEKSRWKPGSNRSNQNIDAHAWLRIRALHAKLYRKVGREDDARKIEDDLSKLLSQADSDHALLVALRKSRAGETIASAKPSQR